MYSIENFQWELHSNKFEWDYNGNHHLLKYDYPLNSVIMLHDDSGFAVVLSNEEANKNNAVIINADGTERFRLQMPIKGNPNAHFYEIFYIGEELNVIINCGGFDQECVLNLVTGQCSNVHMTK
jgi:hypothetical protein